ncbi:MAG: radical SAM protein [Candidatus Bathyarchaeota archaeon]
MVAFRVLFIEPPKDFWFILGEYIPPPLGILALAAYLEEAKSCVEVDVVDCQAEGLLWDGLERRIEEFRPNLVASSGLSTCNAYTALRTVELAKKIDPSTKTVIGGQHFTALADETLRDHKVVDYVVRGEGEITLAELVKRIQEGKLPTDVGGLSFRSDGEIVHNPMRPLILDLDSLPMPGYHLIRDYMKNYYFSLMSEKETGFAIVEGSRGCPHECSYCTQWRFWGNCQRSKSPTRIADEIEHIHSEYGSSFFWLTNDNLGIGERTRELCDELIRRELSSEVTWFCQARCDDLVDNRKLLPMMRKAGNVWMLVGFDSPNPRTLNTFKREGINRENAKEAADLLRENGIFSQGTFVIGERGDTRESIAALREFADWVDPDIATFMALTPFPGTEIYEMARREGWIEDPNWSHYDMIHAIMPTEFLLREEVQEELYECYRSFFGSWPRRYRGFFSENPITRRTYQYLSRKAILTKLRSLF